MQFSVVVLQNSAEFILEEVYQETTANFSMYSAGISTPNNLTEILSEL